LLAERIHKAVSREPYELPGGDSVHITASIGIDGVCPDPKTDDLKTIGDSLLARADVALYRAKSGGRDQIAVDAG
jgi:diguanylate cyclase (GGDEF)-like protein